MNMLKKIDYLPYLELCWQKHLKPREANAPTVISLFAGCGGSSLGYSMAGFRELLAVEWDNNAVETFKLNFPDVLVYHGDITKLSIDECLRLTGLELGQLDILDGSPPCQGFSRAGLKNRGDARNNLFFEYIRLLRALKPKVFVAENVRGMIDGKMKTVFADIFCELIASEYKVSARLMNTKYFNVPQSRERLIFVGVRNDLQINPSHPKAQTKCVTVKDAISNVNNVLLAPIEKGQEIVLPYIQQGSCAIKCVPQKILLQYIPRMAKNKKFSFNGICRRLSNSFPAWTLQKEYISYSNTPIHPTENRFISAEEHKRLASFPDNFVFCGNYKSVVARIGNSVPPLFMYAIAKHIRTEILERMSTAFPALTIERI